MLTQLRRVAPDPPLPPVPGPAIPGVSSFRRIAKNPWVQMIETKESRERFRLEREANQVALRNAVGLKKAVVPAKALCNERYVTKPKETGAERQRRWRERNRAKYNAVKKAQMARRRDGA